MKTDISSRVLRRLSRYARDAVNVVRPAKLARSTVYQLYGYRLTGKELAGLHLGSGPLAIPNFWNLDGDLRVPCDLVGRVDRLKLNAGSVGVVYCSHVFEHVVRRRADRTLREWHRVLKPGGKLYMAVPDLEQLCRVYLDNLPRYDAPDGRHAVDLAAGIIYGGQTTSYDFHFAGYSFTTLKAMLRAVGFSTVERFDRASLTFLPFRDAAYATVGATPVSLNIEATK